MDKKLEVERSSTDARILVIRIARLQCPPTSVRRVLPKSNESSESNHLMSRFFIYRPIFASVISIIIVLAGFVSFGSLPVAKFPPIAPPTVSVTAVYPGGDARTIADTVATPIEQQVNGVEGMIYMSSNSSDDGSYNLTVTFEVGTDIDIASVLVQNRVAIAEAQLPAEVRSQGITTKKQSTQILQFIALTAPGGDLDDLFLSNYALTVKDELSRVGGVGEVRVFGTGDYSMRIWLDPRKLKQRSLTTADVVNAIREQNVQVAAGQIGAPPAPEGTAYQLTVSARGRLVTKEEFEDIIIATAGDGRALRVKDVARVELGGKEYTFDSRFNGQPSASIAIYQLPEANAITTAAAGARKDEGAEHEQQLARGSAVHGRFRHDPVRGGVDRGGLQHACDRGPVGGAGDLCLLAGLARDHYPRCRHPGLADRYLCDHEHDRFFDQHAVAVRDRLGDRHRRG